MAENRTARFGALIGNVADGFDRHNGAQMSGSIAFFVALSAAPLVIVIAAVSVLVLGRQAVSGQLVSHLTPVVGVQATQGLQSAVKVTMAASGKGAFALVAAVVGTIFGAAGAVMQLRTSLNVIFGRDQTSALRAAAGDWYTSTLAVFVIAVAGVVMVMSWVVTAAVEVLPGGPLQTPAEALLTIAVFFGLTALGYRKLPSHRPPWRPCLLGSAVATVVTAVSSAGIMVFLGTGFASSVYGTAASFFLFLMWLWLGATGFIVGAECVRGVAEQSSEARSVASAA